MAKPFKLLIARMPVESRKRIKLRAQTYILYDGLHDVFNHAFVRAMANDIKNQITQATQTFVNEIVSVFANAFSATANGLAGAKPGRGSAKQAAAKPTQATVAKGKPGRPAKAAKAEPTPKAESGKRIRRTEADLLKMGEDVVKLLQKNKSGMRMEAINKAIGTETKELMRPMMKLLEEGKIRKEGERRATVYFAK